MSGKRTVAVILIGLSGLGILSAIGWGLVTVPRLVIPAYTDQQLASVSDPARAIELQDSRIKVQGDLRTSLVQLLAGVVVAGGLFLTYRQMRINRDGQLTDRFTAAIDQLSEDANLSKTLGGIYGLERIARDSRSDRNAIQEVLAAYVRQYSPWPPKPGQPGESVAREDLDRLAKRLPAVQAALTVLGRMPRPLDKDHRMDLRRTDLRRADLHGANLRYADLEQAHLEHAWLRGADIRDVVLWGTQFSGAKLHDVRMGDYSGGGTVVWPEDFNPAIGAHVPVAESSTAT